MHILVFPGWYPSKVDKLSGDFVQRHMQAIAKNAKVTVVFPVKDNSIKEAKTEVQKNGQLTEHFCYYPSSSSIPLIDNLFSFIRYNYTCYKIGKQAHKEQKVDLVHIYIIQKNHLLGLLFNFFFKIDFVISEQSTLYVDGRLEKMRGFQHKVLQHIFNKAASYHAVSKYLLNTLKDKLKIKKTGVVIPNVVAADLFYYNNDLGNDLVTFVHVSNMFHQKNVEGMLEAFAEVKKKNGNFLLNLVGPLPEKVKNSISELNLEKHVKCWHERNYKEVAEIMQQSDVFVFFTRYETFGCVIIEANACGLPVIISDLEVTRELITDKKNGLFVESENVQDLAEKLLYAIEHPETFDPIGISLQTRNRFNYDKISLQFINWYQEVISKNTN